MAIKLNHQLNIIKDSPASFIFLHGLGGNLKAWNPIVSKLNQLGYTTISFDLPGHGDSPNTFSLSDYTQTSIVHQVHQVVAKHKLTNPILVGHCYGGFSALTYTHLYPKELKALVLISTTYKLFTPKHSLNSRFIKKVILSLLKNLAPSRQQTYIRDWDLLRLFREIIKTTPSGYFLSVLGALSFNATRYLANISCPTHVIHGVGDSVIPYTLAKELAQKIPKSCLTLVPQANHIIVINQPQTIAKLLRKVGQSIKQTGK